MNSRSSLLLLSMLLGCGPGLEVPLPATGGLTTAPTTVRSLCQKLADNAVCVAEAQSRNESTVQLSPGVFPDWIELENQGSTTVEAGRITVQIGNSDPWPLSGSDLAPDALRLLWADGEEADDHLPFSLSSDGELVQVFVDGVLSDQLDVPALGRDLAYGQYAGGADTSCTPSPGLPNGPATACADLRELVFELGAIHDFELSIDPDNWALLETSTTFDHPHAIAGISFEGGEFPVVEINLKGGYGSFRPDMDTQKTGFKVDLDAFEEHSWRGLSKLTLNNLVQDPTFTHEYLTFLLYRELGIPAPRVAFARVHLNGVYMGFYALVESVDGAFLEDWYGNKDGHLFEAAYGPDFDAGEEWLFDYDRGPNEAAGRAQIAAVTALLDSSPRDETTYAALRTMVDMDQWMLNMAVEAAVWHWDGYWTENNNRMYQDPTTGLWTIIPHGADQTWVDGWPSAYQGSAQPRLYDFCMNVPSCRAMYSDQLLKVADVVEATPFEAELDTLIALTEPEFLLDPRVEEAGNRPGQLATTRTRIQTVVAELRAVSEP